LNTNKTYRYTAFGLQITSTIEIPEFLRGDISKNEDVLIQTGKTPVELEKVTFKGVRFQAAPGEFLLKVDHIAEYYVKDGTNIFIYPDEKAPSSDIRLFLLGSVMGALIHQRGLLPFHGSAITYKNRAFIFSGISGTGKSTLAASFSKEGFPLITDDICTISLNSKNKPIVHPGYPQMKLWADTLEKLGENKISLKKVREGIKKYAYPLENKFINSPYEIAGVYILGTKNTEGLHIETLKGIEKFNALKNNTYRLNFLKATGKTSSHFGHIESISRNCFVKRIERPTKGFNLSELHKTVLDDMLLSD
jgi:hypothetical protein